MNAGSLEGALRLQKFIFLAVIAMALVKIAVASWKRLDGSVT